MNPVRVNAIKKQLAQLGVVREAEVTYNEASDVHNFDFGRFQLQVQNIFDQGNLDEELLWKTIAEMFSNLVFLTEEVTTLQDMFDTYSYSQFLEASVMKQHLERLNRYIAWLEDYIGIEPTSADEENLTIGEKD